MDISQYIGVFIATYFISHFLLAWLYPNVDSRFRNSEAFISWKGFLFMNTWPRLIGATVGVLCTWLWQ